MSAPTSLPPRDFTAVVASAQAALNSGVGLESALRELLDWVGSTPSPGEQQDLIANGDVKYRAEAAEDYIALPVRLVLAPYPGQVVTVPGPDGPYELVQVLFALQCPLGNLVTSRILNADGSMPSPVQGMLPLVQARWIMPRRKVTPEALEAIRRSGWV